MKRLRKFFALAPAGRAIVLRSLFFLPMVAALLRLRGMRRTRAWLARFAPPAAGHAPALAPGEIARLVGVAAAMLRTSCLPRSLVLCHFLGECGASAEIRLGVSRLADGSLSAHAWVEFDGMPLNDAPDVMERYAVLPSIAGQPRAGLAATRSL